MNSKTQQRRVSISDARRLCKTLGARGVIVISYDPSGQFAAASYGATVADCKTLGRVLDGVPERFLSWPVSPSPAPLRPQRPHGCMYPSACHDIGDACGDCNFNGGEP